MYLPLEMGVVLHLNNLEPLSLKAALCQVWINCLVVLQKKINVFSLFRNYFPWKRAWPFIWKYLNPFTPGGELAKWFWRRRFLKFVNVFLLFSNFLPLEKGVAIIWTNLHLLHQGMLCAKFRWKWPSGSGEEDVKSLRQQQQQRRRTNCDQKSSLSRAFGSGELKKCLNK